MTVALIHSKHCHLKGKMFNHYTFNVEWVICIFCSLCFLNMHRFAALNDQSKSILACLKNCA